MVSTAAGTHGAEARSEALRRGPAIDDADFAILYKHYQPMLTRHAARRGSNDSEGSADLAMFDGYKAISRGNFIDQPEAAFRSYIYQAVDSHVADEHRRVRPTLTDFDEDLSTEEDNADDAVDRIWLQALLDDLSEAQRETIRGRFLLDLDAREVGRLLDKDPNAVHQLQHRALRRLRKLIAALALTAAAIAGAVAIHQLLSNENSIDTTPIERPDTTTTTTALDDNRITTPTRGEAERRDAVGDGPAPEPIQGSDTSTADGPTGPIGDPRETTGQATTSTASPVTSRSTDSTASPGTVSPTPSTGGQSSTPAGGPSLLNPPNICVSEQLSATLWQHRLHVGTSNPQAAAVFVPVPAVRFVDAGGAVLHVVDTSRPMATGLTPDTHGWVSPGDPAGTFANYDQAPQPSYWGVLTSANAVDGWTSIQYSLDGGSPWLDILNCG